MSKILTIILLLISINLFSWHSPNGDDLITYDGPFTIPNSQTLSSPSIAINRSGDRAVITWRHESENSPVDSSDLIMYAEIDTLTGIHTTYNYIYGNYKVAYTKAAPIVIWRQEYVTNDYIGRFIIFWSSRDNLDITDEESNWQIKYAMETYNSSEMFSSLTQTKAFTLKLKETTGVTKDLNNFWMPMGGTCDFQPNDVFNRTSCVLFFNETFPNSTDMDYQKLTRVFITRDPSDINKLIVDKNKGTSQYFRYSEKINYGHLNILKTPDTLSDRFLLTYIKKAAKSVLSAYRVKVMNTTSGHGTSTSNDVIIENNSNKVSRTGFSGTLNESTGKMRFVWIEE